ncbi:MAG: DUF4097 family beta strand repeat protein [Luteitalea sp.]|nr:DUF4097 family beta strand repeat protein [Luteitalea sp.]
MPTRTAWRWSALLRATTLLALAVVALRTEAAAQCKDDGPDESETVSKALAFPDGGRLELKSFSGSVTIRGTARNDVAIKAVRRAPRERLERVTLSMESSSSGVRIEANKHNDDCKNNNVVETHFEIEMPLEGGIDVSVFSSPVTVADVAGDVRVRSFSSAIKLSGVSAPVHAKAFSGTLDVSLADATTAPELMLETFSGDVTVHVPASAQAGVEFNSFSGDLESDLPLVLRKRSGRRLEASLNTSDDTSLSNHIKVKTFSGDVALK